MSCPNDLFRNVYVFDHALDAYQIHFPQALHRELLYALTQGEEIETQTAMGLLGRKPSSFKEGDRFVLATHRRGLFVVSPALHIRNGEERPDLKPWNVVTYLRFQRQQEADAHRMWPSSHAAPPPDLAQPNPDEPDVRQPLDKARQKARQLGVYPLFWDTIDEWGFSHAPHFVVELKNARGDVLAEGEGESKLEAAHDAAANWLRALERKGV